MAAKLKPFKVKPGALHKQIGYPKDKPISTTALNTIVHRRKGGKFNGHTVTPKMKQRARFALNARKW